MIYLQDLSFGCKEGCTPIIIRLLKLSNIGQNLGENHFENLYLSRKEGDDFIFL